MILLACWLGQLPLPNGDTPWLVCGGVSSVPLDHLPAVLEGTSGEGDIRTPDS